MIGTGPGELEREQDGMLLLWIGSLEPRDGWTDVGRCRAPPGRLEVRGMLASGNKMSLRRASCLSTSHLHQRHFIFVRLCHHPGS